jgi:WS/DGAT/MGAT family acyltransferase
MERMSTLDAGFFYMEDENVPMHVGSVLVFEGPPPAYGDLVRLLVAKLAQVPRYRQRVRTVPLHLGRPMWTDDEHFQILYHVRHTAVPAPGGEEQLRNLAGRVFAQRLDMSKPLWEIWLVEGLADNRWAIINKTHHCMVDGVAGMDLAAVILELSPHSEPPTPQEWTPAPQPSAVEAVLGGVRDAIVEPLQQLAAVPALARHVPTRQELIDFGRGLPANLRRLASSTVSSLNGPIGPHRRWEWVRANLGEVKEVRKAFGGTVNDVVLAAVTRGFRDLLGGRDELADGQVVRSLVPVSVRAPSAKGKLNNQVSALLVNLPVGEPDPLLRLALLREQMDDLKSSRQAVGAQALSELAGFAAPTLLAMGTRLTFRYPQSLMQTVTTNVPGPRFPLYLLGRQLVEIYPYVPIAINLRISIGIVSYLDQLNFGVNADFDAEPDVAVLTRGIRAGFDELLALAQPVPPKEPAVKPRATGSRAGRGRRATSAAKSRGPGGAATGP